MTTSISRVGEHRGFPELQGTPVHLGQRLDLDRQRQRGREDRADGDHPMIGEKACAAAVQRGDRMVGQLLRAERRVRRTADVAAARHRDHVVERRNAAVQARERRCERRMHVDDRADVTARAVDVAVESPFGRRQPRAARRAIDRHCDDVVRASYRHTRCLSA